MTKSKVFWIVAVLIGAAVIAVLVFRFAWVANIFGDGDGKSGTEESVTTIVVTPGSACLKEGEKQQFEANVEDVSWSMKPLFPIDPAMVIAGIDQDGLLTAYKIGLGTVVASKGSVHGSANFSIIPKGTSCSAKFKKSEEKTEDEEEDDDENGEEGENGGGESGPVSADSSGSTNKWSANFEATLKYEVNNGFEEIGFVTHEMNGGFVFTVDYASGKLELTEPAGFVNVEITNEIPSCSTVALNDPFLFVETTDGKLVDTDFVFGKKFITADHKEGVKMSCLHKSYSIPEASVIDSVGQYGFPLTVEAKDGATAPIHASFTFSGRQAEIDGKVTISRVAN